MPIKVQTKPTRKYRAHNLGQGSRCHTSAQLAPHMPM
jgi:hypothetical protein